MALPLPKNERYERVWGKSIASQSGAELICMGLNDFEPMRAAVNRHGVSTQIVRCEGRTVSKRILSKQIVPTLEVKDGELEATFLSGVSSALMGIILTDAML